jgi:phosphonate transport system permease protein
VTVEATSGRSPAVTAFQRRYAAERRRLRCQTALFGGLFVLCLIVSASMSNVSLAQFASGLPAAWGYVASTLPSLHVATLGSDLSSWYWNWPHWLVLLAETALMSFMGTALGSIAAFLLCFLASRNLCSSRILQFLARRVLELARTVPDIVYAMIFVFGFGIGALPGVLALAVHTTGALGKLFSEVNESVDARPIESIAASGGNWPAIMRLAVVPQVLPNFASYILLRFEYNIRSASVLGLVGAGGIGEELYLAIRQFDLSDISAILLLIIALVMMADLSCEAIRHRLIGREAMGRAL